VFILTELGLRLQEARKEKGLSIEDVAEITKIQKRYLIGLEEGNYDIIPGKFYVRAFIKQYAEAVGLDPDQIFEEYQNEIPSAIHDELPSQLSRVQSRKKLSPGSSKWVEWAPKALIGLFIVGALVLVYYLVQKYAGSSPDVVEEDPAYQDRVNIEQANGADLPVESIDQEEEENNEEDQQADEPEEVVEEPKQELNVLETKGSSTTYELVNTDTFELTINSLGETWVEVYDSNNKQLLGETLVQSPKSPNQKQSVTFDMSNEKQVRIRIGRAPDTEIQVNGEPLQYAISPTERDVQTITITFTPPTE
jgi:cytoskeletal protein RodZ